MRGPCPGKRLLAATPRLLVGLTLALTGCAVPGPAAGPTAATPPGGTSVGTSGSVAAGSGATPIKIGSLADLGGPFAALGAETHISTDLVVSQVNATGGIDGHPLQVTYVDPRSDPNQAIQLATQLVQQDHVDVLMGATGSAECLAIGQLAPKLGVVYVPSNGCAADERTTKSCNANTFRVFPNGTQLLTSETATLVSRYGKTWGVLYPDYEFGQSQLAAFQAALAAQGGSVASTIAVPLSEPNQQPYVTRIPTDGSIVGLLDVQGGTDLVRGLQAMQSFGVLEKVPVVLGAGGREFFGGVYPQEVDGAITAGTEPSKPRPDNAYEQAFQKAFAEQAAKQDPAITQILGGADKATPGTTLGYQAYISMTALKLAMQAAHFTGQADTDRLVQAFATLQAPQGPDFPSGAFSMTPTDHQGRTSVYVLKVNVQQQGEDVIDTIPAQQLPVTDSCHV